jgi:chondroitin AC lyase
MDRLRRLAVAWAQPVHPLHGSTQVLSALDRGLQWWLESRPRSTNWWFNTIGPQLALLPVLALAGPALPRTRVDAAAALLHDPSMVPRAQATGQNLVWYATQQLVRGVVIHEPEDIAHASQRLQQEIQLSTREGAVQHDYSFHQHGPQLYTGGYGLGFLMDNVELARWLRDTPWSYGIDRLMLLVNYTLWGIRPLVRGTWLDWGARGREFTREARQSRSEAIRPAIQALSGLVPRAPAELAQFAEYLAERRSGPPWVGNRHYWRSDFMVHQTEHGYLSVKCVSARTVGTESGDNENLLGYWLPFGTTFLLRRGDELDATLAVLDWSRLPGTTAPSRVPAFTGLLRHGEHFVGGVSDSTSGGMVVRVDTPYVRARKAYFLHGDLLVALGCDIHGDTDSPIATTLDQKRTATPVSLDGGVTSAASGTSARVAVAWHDGITYFGLDGERIAVARSLRRGDGRAANTGYGGGSETAEMLLLTIDHGVRPTGAEYRFGVWLGAGRPEAARTHPRVEVLANDADCQSIHLPEDGLRFAVMHSPGTLPLGDGLALEARAPCMLMVRRKAGFFEVHAADPTTRLTQLVVNLTRDGNRVTQQRVALPTQTAEAGRTVRFEFARPAN